MCMCGDRCVAEMFATTALEQFCAAKLSELVEDRVCAVRPGWQLASVIFGRIYDSLLCAVMCLEPERCLFTLHYQC